MIPQSELHYLLIQPLENFNKMFLKMHHVRSSVHHLMDHLSHPGTCKHWSWPSTRLQLITHVRVLLYRNRRADPCDVLCLGKAGHQSTCDSGQHQRNAWKLPAKRSSLHKTLLTFLCVVIMPLIQHNPQPQRPVECTGEKNPVGTQAICNLKKKFLFHECKFIQDLINYRIVEWKIHFVIFSFAVWHPYYCWWDKIWFYVF